MRVLVRSCGAEGPYEMKRHAQPHAESAYRPRVVRDFRTQEDD